MHILLQLDLPQTREFFAAFFDLRYAEWSGFLSSRLTLAELVAFGLSLFARSTNEARLSLVLKGLTGLPELVATLVGVGRIEAAIAGPVAAAKAADLDSHSGA